MKFIMKTRLPPQLRWRVRAVSCGGVKKGLAGVRNSISLPPATVKLVIKISWEREREKFVCFSGKAWIVRLNERAVSSRGKWKWISIWVRQKIVFQRQVNCTQKSFYARFFVKYSFENLHILQFTLLRFQADFISIERVYF